VGNSLLPQRTEVHFNKERVEECSCVLIAVMSHLMGMSAGIVDIKKKELTMPTRDEVIECLVDEFHIWDDMAEELVENYGELIIEDTDIFAVATAVIQAECKRLGVTELPEDYIVTEFEDNDEDGDDDED
jgi:hypothetical protein